MQEEYESYFESHFELLGPSIVEVEKEEGPKKWRVLAFTFDPPLIGYGSILLDALDQASGQISYRKVNKS
jgi:hypothetical protein